MLLFFISRTKLLLFPDICKYITIFHPSISLVNYALFTHNTRTIDAQYTHYSNTFISGSVAFESYSSIYCLSTTCLVLGNFPPSKFSSTTLDGGLPSKKNRPPRRFFLLNQKYFTTIATDSVKCFPSLHILV